MKENSDFIDSAESHYFQIIKNNLSPLDLFIISKINKGFSIEEISKMAEKKFNIKDSKKTIDSRFKKLISENNPERRIILQPHPQYIINPAKIFDSIFLIFIKANFHYEERKHLDINIQNIFDTIIDLNNKPRFGNPIKQLFTMTGWMFDFVGIVYENNIERFHAFRMYLLNEGIAQTVNIVPINTNSGFLFNPISTPDTNDFKQFLVHYHNRMKCMIDELTTNDIDSTKTIKFFNKDDYGLQVISQKFKGEIYPMESTELKIGRYQDNDIIIQDIAVSRRHAKISKIGNRYIFQDQSTNGSFINDKKLVFDETELKHGDIIKIGNQKFQFKKLYIEKNK